MNIEVEDLRITKLRDYLINVIDEITSKNSKINANALSKDIDSYSIDKIPAEISIEKWITGEEIHQDTFSFRSRKDYSYDEIKNLENIGFYELFENKIMYNNNNRILPEIEGIESIECLSAGSLEMANTGTAEFSIQVRITYRIGG